MISTSLVVTFHHQFTIQCQEIQYPPPHFLAVEKTSHGALLEDLLYVGVYSSKPEIRITKSASPSGCRRTWNAKAYWP